MFRATVRTAPKIRTRGQAEEMGSRLLVVGGTTAGVGLLLCLTIVLAWLGMALIALGGVTILGTIGWMFWLMKHPSQEVRCPACRKRHAIFASVHEFACDDCHHVLAAPAATRTREQRVPV